MPKRQPITLSPYYFRHLSNKPSMHKIKSLIVFAILLVGAYGLVGFVDGSLLSNSSTTALNNQKQQEVWFC